MGIASQASRSCIPGALRICLDVGTCEVANIEDLSTSYVPIYSIWRWSPRPQRLTQAGAVENTLLEIQEYLARRCIGLSSREALVVVLEKGANKLTRIVSAKRAKRSARNEP